MNDRTILIQRQREDEIAPRLPVRVEIERRVHAALERVVEDEVQPVQMIDLKALNRTFDEIPIRRLDAFRCEACLEPGELRRIEYPNGNVGDIALVAPA